MKRLFSFILCFGLILSNMGVAAEEKQLSSDYSATYEKLDNLGLLSDELNFNDENAPVKRVDFIIAALKLINQGKSQVTEENLFTDVDKDYFAAGYIKKGVESGFLSGYSDGSFLPENPIALNQAVKIMVRLLGYSEIASANGGYPNGYLSVAYDKDLLKGVSADEVLTYADMLKLFENAIETDIMSLVLEGENISFEEKEEENLLSAYHDIYYEEGVVNSNDITALAGFSSSAEGCVNVGGEEFFSGNSNIASKLGYSVEFYYRKTDDDIKGTILHFEEDDKNYVERVGYEDIIKTNSAYSFSYYDERDRKETVTIKADTNVLVNGKIKPFYSKEDLNPDYGEVILIDNNDDGEVDVIDVFSVTDTVIVGTTALRDGKFNITDKLNPEKVLTIDEDEEYLLLGDGTEIIPTDLAEWSVILIGKSEDGYLKMYVSDKSVEGKVEGISEGNKAVINGTEYIISGNYLELSEKLLSVRKIEPGTESTFYLDSFGSVAAMALQSEDELHYGFVFRVSESEEEENKILIKMLTDENKTGIFETPEKVKLNGKNVEGSAVKGTLNSQNSKDEGRKENAVRQIISYTLNDEGKIKSLNTVGATEALRYEGSFTSDFYYDFYLGTWSREFWEYSKTKTFCIYEDEEQCQVVSSYASVLSEQNKDYTMYFYNKDDLLQVDVALRYFEGEASSKSAPISADNLMLMAEKITYGLDEDNNGVKMIEAIDVKGNRHTIYVSDTTNSFVEGVFNTIVPGDVFIYTTSNIGKLTGITKIFDSKRYSEYGSQGQDSSQRGNPVHGVLEYGTIHSTRANIYAKALYVKDKNLVYEVESGKPRMIRLTSAPVAIMNISNPEKIEITTGLTTADIIPGNNILVSAKWNTVNGAIVIIK